jgi:SAM-dependent methyltransferase
MIPVRERDQQSESCIVCGSTDVALFTRVSGRTYLRCHVCKATFLEPAQRPSPREEYERYLEHDNDPEDQGYRNHLQRVVTPLLERLDKSSSGLDYGSGPGPVLAEMIRQAGHSIELFDLNFHADYANLDQFYDFITCTETIEHFHRPAEEFARFDWLLRPGGWLALMTCFQTDDSRFENWHYRRDKTHIVFYREETLRYLAKLLGWNITIPEKDIALMQKPRGGPAPLEVPQ